MGNYLSQFKFNNKKASLVSVIIHDNLEGDYLFVGHVGVLVNNNNDFLFIEKLSFEEPYQAIKFSTTDACFSYLKNKHLNFCGQGLVKPFVMDNSTFIK